MIIGIISGFGIVVYLAVIGLVQPLLLKQWFKREIDEGVADEIPLSWTGAVFWPVTLVVWFPIMGMLWLSKWPKHLAVYRARKIEAKLPVAKAVK